MGSPWPIWIMRLLRRSRIIQIGQGLPINLSRENGELGADIVYVERHYAANLI